MSSLTLAFAEHGAEHAPCALGAPELAALEHVSAGCDGDRAGARLQGIDGLARLIGPASGLGALAAQALQAPCIPVRAVLFDKNAAANRALGWHQDRTIVVRERHEVEGFGPWSVKQGLIHVEPPIAILQRMATLRVHLDPVPAGNAPLLVALGSHRLGRIPSAEIAAVVARCPIQTCLAEAGDVWLTSTPILHASDAAAMPTHRRVLQIDYYAAAALPGGLDWLGL
jgi:Phytanoyl-CoA dioxygenase (PhyH)